jgi:hypothetical protein
LSDSDSGLEEVPDLVVGDCSNWGVNVVERLNYFNKTFFDAKFPDNLPQAVVSHPVKRLLDVYKIVDQIRFF